VPIPTLPLPLTKNNPLPLTPFIFNKLLAVLLLISNLAPGFVVPIPILPLSNIEPVATVEADENFTT